MPLDGMSQREAGSDLVVVATATANSRDVSGLLQLPDDALHGALRDADQIGNVAHPNLRLARQTQENVRVIGQERPRRPRLVFSERRSLLQDRIRGAAVAIRSQGATS